MKSALIVILIISSVFAVAVVTLRALHVTVNPIVPVLTGVVAVAAGLAGILPLIRSQQSDPGTLLQKAMAGTMLHMLVAAGLSIGVIVLQPHAQRLGLIFWILGGYWVSLLTVVWRSRQIIVHASAIVTTIPDGNQAAMKAH